MGEVNSLPLVRCNEMLVVDSTVSFLDRESEGLAFE